MQTLTPEQENQIISMLKDGKHSTEIIEFFRNSYQITIPHWKVAYIKGKIEKPKKQKKTAIVEPETEVTVTELITIIGQIDTGYKALLKKIRVELLKSRAQVFKMLEASGIDLGMDLKERE